MGTLYLVRHGQASFGAQNYDQLSERGRQQSVQLGNYWRQRGLTFDAIVTGTLQRHLQTWQGIAEGADLSQRALGLPGLNEYDSDAVIASVHPDPLPKPDSPDLYRQHFRLLRQGLIQWMHGELQPKGMPTWAAFLSGVISALDQVRQGGQGNVLLVSSGGPIASAIGHELGAPPEAVVELNLRIRNTAVTEFVFNPKRHALLSFNQLPHLDAPEHAHLVTYA